MQPFRTKRPFKLISALLLLGLTGPILAQQDPAGESPNAELEGIRLDHEALRSMTPEERRTAMRTYKAARAAAAERAGLELNLEGGYVPLETPRAVANTVRMKGLSGTIQYDSGNVMGTAGIASQMLGNRFDSALNTAGTICCVPVESSGSITMITFDMVNTFFGSVVWSLYSNVVGTMADQVTSMARPGIMTGLNTLSVMSPATANAYSNGTFLAGIWQFDTTMTGLGVDTATTGGQGFHAISLNDGAMGSMLTTVTTGMGGGLNAVFRVSGWVLTPVELMSFEIEESD